MVSQATYYSTSASDGGRRYNPHRPSYPPYLEFPGHERRFHPSPSHDAHARPATMTDQQMDIDSAPQRKRIAVAVSFFFLWWSGAGGPFFFVYLALVSHQSPPQKADSNSADAAASARFAAVETLARAKRA